MANVENLGTLERRVSMTLPVADIEKQVDERLKKRQGGGGIALEESGRGLVQAGHADPADAVDAVERLQHLLDQAGAVHDPFAVGVDSSRPDEPAP